ncbi:Cytochrome c oxidase subunit 6b-2 [Bienertia sinuspersici]
MKLSQESKTLTRFQNLLLDDKIELKTAPADFRFPTTNQTRHCFTRYIEFHRCLEAKGEESDACEKFARYYRALCPGEWLVRVGLVSGGYAEVIDGWMETSKHRSLLSVGMSRGRTELLLDHCNHQMNDTGQSLFIWKLQLAPDFFADAKLSSLLSPEP